MFNLFNRTLMGTLVPLQVAKDLKDLIVALEKDGYSLTKDQTTHLYTFKIASGTGRGFDASIIARTAVSAYAEEEEHVQGVDAIGTVADLSGAPLLDIKEYFDPAKNINLFTSTDPEVKFIAARFVFAPKSADSSVQIEAKYAFQGAVLTKNITLQYAHTNDYEAMAKLDVSSIVGIDPTDVKPQAHPGDAVDRDTKIVFNRPF